MKKRKYKVYACDFETTVYKGQTNTEVWAAAAVELFTEDVKIYHSLPELFEAFKQVNSNIIAYFHNLKFDGMFWLSFLMTELKLQQACEYLPANDKEELSVKWLKESQMQNNSFKYSISDRGMWYTITIKVNNKIIEIRDSLKLLPFSIRKIGNSFGTKHKKLEMEYTGLRYAGCTITDDERSYIANDVLVLKEALEIMFQQGHDKLTIGSCCLAEYERIIGKEDYKIFFPNIYEVQIDESVYGVSNAGEFIRRSYRGGWCYLCTGKEQKIYRYGLTADVNSLYPSVMHSDSGNRYPVGKPVFWKGNFIPDEAIAPNKFYFIKVKTRFYLRSGMLPFIQIKSSMLYDGTEMLKTSDVYDPITGKYYGHYKGIDGKIHDTRVELTFTMMDYKLFIEHYEPVDFEIIGGCWFYSEIGLFDEYINKYKVIKMNSKGAVREIAKLFLNNLYGKMASNEDSSFKYAIVKDDGTIGFLPVYEMEKTPGYIPIGSAITSYARNFTIRAAQLNYHGVDRPVFIYADTDSIHCDLKPEDLVGVPLHDTEFNHWKLESCWDEAIFVRQKTYIEHITHENLQPIDAPYYNVKCAGMPDKCKSLFLDSMKDKPDLNNRTDEELDFLSTHRTLTDFKPGLCVPGKLRPKRIPGGVLLVETTYEMR